MEVFHSVCIQFLICNFLTALTEILFKTKTSFPHARSNMALSGLKKNVILTKLYLPSVAQVYV